MKPASRKQRRNTLRCLLRFAADRTARLGSVRL